MTGRQRLPAGSNGKRSMTILSVTLMAVGLCILGIASFSSENADQKRRYLAVKSRSQNTPKQKINTRSPDGNEANPLRRLETQPDTTERHLAVANPPPASDIISSEYIVTVATGRNMPKADVTAASLISTYGGTLMATYEQTIKGFSAILTESQAAAMALDASVVLMENNYKVYARGMAQAVPIAEHARNLQSEGMDEEAGSKRRLSDEQAQTKRMLEETFIDDGHRSLAMWRWNNVDDPSQNWGLDRMSSRGPETAPTCISTMARALIYMFLIPEFIQRTKSSAAGCKVARAAPAGPVIGPTRSMARTSLRLPAGQPSVPARRRRSIPYR